MPITRSEIIEAIHEGTRVANKRYEKWTRGWWLHDSGVEGLLVAGIAEVANKLQDGHESLLMEASFGYIRCYSGAKPRPGPLPKTFSRGKRADIVLFNGNDQATRVIEVKRSWKKRTCLQDLERIRDLVSIFSHKHGGSLRRGFLALMIARSSTKRPRKYPEERIWERLAEIRNILEPVRAEFKKKGQNLRYCPSEVWMLPQQYQDESVKLGAASLCIEISSRIQIPHLSERDGQRRGR